MRNERVHAPPVGTYIVIEPAGVAVHMLDRDANNAWRERRELAAHSQRAMRDAVRCTFGATDALEIIPACHAPLLLAVAETYDGAHAEQVRGIAACMLLGRPWSKDSAPPDNNEGGKRVAAPAAAPKRPRPGGGTFAELMTSSK